MKQTNLGANPNEQSNAQQQPESKRVQTVNVQPDINGRPTSDKRVDDERTSGSTGLAAFDLTPGIYAVAVDGYEPKLVPVEAGKVQTIRLSPGGTPS